MAAPSTSKASVVFAGGSALRILRAAQSAGVRFQATTKGACLPSRSPRLEQVCSAIDLVDGMLAGLRLERPVTLLAGAGAHRSVEGLYAVSSCSAALPKGSLLRVAKGVFVCSPELAFLREASRGADDVELLELGFELCGTYRMIDGMPHYDLEPLTSASRIRNFINRTDGIQGRRAALQACQWLLDGSGSPAETALAIVLGLPYRKGGFGLRDFVLNREITLNESAAHLLGRQTMRPDIYFVPTRHPVEFDGRMFHSGNDQLEFDQRRRAAYDAMGMGVTVLTTRHLLNTSLLNEEMKALRRNVGQRQNRVPANYDMLQAELFANAFRYWQDLHREYGSGTEFGLRASSWDEPDSPW